MIALRKIAELPARLEKQALHCLQIGGYDRLVEKRWALNTDQSVPLVAFAHRPFDARSACIAILSASDSPQDDINLCAKIGAPVFFTVGKDEWNMWSLREGGPRHYRTLKAAEVENYFQREQKKLSPRAIFRAKAWVRTGEAKELSFVDAGLLPHLELDLGKRLVSVFADMLKATLASLGMDKVPDAKSSEAHELIRANFWLLAAKMLHDKEVENFIRLDFAHIETVLGRVAKHYHGKTPPSAPYAKNLGVLTAAANIVARQQSFRMVSAESLGALYEESLVTKDIRKLLNIHRTPTYLVDYMMAKLSRYMEREIGAENCRIIEPACGHAPFLTGALRLLSDILPEHIARDEDKRNRFLRDNLHGIDCDPFALELARLSLTLADVPKPNGWALERGDLYAADNLERSMATCNVTLCNPPFAEDQAGEFFRRTVDAMQPGTAFGFVLPSTVLTGKKWEPARRRLLADCEIREIAVFPDEMFRFASVETGILIGRKHEARQAGKSASIFFRRIREDDIEGFKQDYDDTWHDDIPRGWFEENDTRLIVPELRELWAACEKLPRFEDVAEIGKGFEHRSSEDPRFPKGAVTESDTKLVASQIRGFASMDDAPETHLAPEKRWLNLDKAVIRRPVSGINPDERSQVIMNYSPADRDAWRIKAYLDKDGRPATSDFLTIRPRTSAYSLECLWAICNSPVANSRAFSWGTKRHITAGLMRKMPVPDFGMHNTTALQSAVNAYFAAAREFSRTVDATPKKQKKTKRNESGQMLLGISKEPTADEIATAKDQLRALHWRVDAEVLKLYALPPELEGKLLDLFDGISRVGVPFEQKGYIPLDFRDVLTLEDFLRITDEWEVIDERRCDLIEKEYKSKRRPTCEDQCELAELQRLLELRQAYEDYLDPMPTAKLDAALARLEAKFGSNK